MEPFRLNGNTYLAIPQLAYDAPGSPASMNGGDSNTDVLLLRLESGGWQPHQRLPVPGGEDAEFFEINERRFLAVASVRSGAGPYSYKGDSVVFEWDGREFVEFQRFACFAAKQWRHFSFSGRHFLGLAQGVWLPGTEPDDLPSVIFEWDGGRLVEFQEIPSKWAYNWHHLSVEGVEYLAHADHVEASRLYRFDGHRFVEHQELMPKAGRAFAHFTLAGGTYLACAVIEGDSVLFRWDGERFVHHQMLAGSGGREFEVIEMDGETYLIRVNFITGGRDNPKTDLLSQVYHFDGDRLEVIQEFPTYGGTDATFFHEGGNPIVAVSNSLSADIRFTTDSVLYEFC
jgi:EPTP domain